LNILERATLLADDELILPEHLPIEVRHMGAGYPQGRLPVTTEIVPLDEVEQRYLAQVASSYQGDRDSLAEMLGISKRTLFRKLQKLQAG